MNVALSSTESRPQVTAGRERPGFAHRGTAITAVVLLALSTLIVIWARTRPSFDAFGWLTWGRQTLAWSLDTNAAPSWKPLPYLFTVPYAVFGHGQLYLWMITVVALSLLGVVCAARIAYRLVAVSPERHIAGLIAGAFAGAALLGIQDYPHYILSAQSDPMIVTLCLAAIDAHLCGRPRLAFVLACLGGLGRPEVWPFQFVYGVWLWRRVPGSRALVVGAAVATAALWFGIPGLTSRSWFVAGTNAQGSVRALKHDRVFGTIDRFLDMHYTPLELAALLGIALAAWRREKTVLALAGAMVAWVLVEIAFALHGWPGLTRYMFEAGAVMVVLAGVAIGWLVPGREHLRAIGSLAGRDGIGRALGAAVALVIVVALIPAAVARTRAEHRDLRTQRARTAMIDQLGGIVRRLGGTAVLARCGEPLTNLQFQTALAWTLHINVVRIGWKYTRAISSARPIIIYDPHRNYWRVLALRQTAPGCPRLPRFTRL